MFYRAPLAARGKGRRSHPRPELRLEVYTHRGFIATPFVVDTGSAFCEIRIDVAEQLKIPFSRDKPVDHLRSADGTEMKGWWGSINLRMPASLGGTIHVWDCIFLEPPPPRKPSVAPAKRKRPRDAQEWQQALEDQIDGAGQKAACLLGRCGFLAHYSVLIDAGHLTIFPGGQLQDVCRELRPPSLMRRLQTRLRRLLGKSPP